MENRTISHFTITRLIGEGGMGVVWEATDTELHRSVALKVLKPEFLAKEDRRVRFIREARSAAKVTHPNLCTIYEIGEHEGEIFLAMELIDGRTLRDEIGGQPLPINRTLQLAAQIAEGLAAAHAASVIHRDLKPENVMVDDAGRPRILDFGLAKALQGPLSDSDSSEAETVAGVTREGRILGTVAYMSPEQARGLEVDTRSDVFSFGVTLYEMVTGKAPFLGATNTDTLARILRDEPTPAYEINPEVPAELLRIMTKCLAKEPDERYQDTRDLALDLRQLVRQSDSGSLAPASSSGSGSGVMPRVDSSELAAAGAGRASWFERNITIGRMGMAFGFATAIVSMVWVFGNLNRRPPVPPRIVAPAQAIENSLAVMPFRNLKDEDDPERLGQILQELLITDLSGVDGLRLFSSQRLYDLQKQLAGSRKRVYDREMASLIARRAGAQIMLEGTISQLGERWIMTAQLIDVGDGTVVGSQRIDGDDLYSMVDELTDRLHGEPRLAAASRSAKERPSRASVRDRTSASLDAYRFYLAGVELLDEGDHEAAADTLARAIELDPAFGQAYYKQAMALWWLNGDVSSESGTPIAQEPLIEMLNGKMNVSRKERMMAEAAFALFGNDWTESIATYEQITKEFPDEKEGWYGLGEAIFHSGIRSRVDALEPFQTAIRLDPNFTLAYEHVFDLTEQTGDFEAGLECAQMLLKANPDDETAHRYWVQMASLAGDEEEVERALEAARRKFHDGAPMRRVFVDAANAHRSRMDLGSAEEFLQMARETDPEGVDMDWFRAMGRISRDAGDVAGFEKLVEEALKALPHEMQDGLKGARIEIHAMEGDWEGMMRLAEQAEAEDEGYNMSPAMRVSGFRAMEHADFEEILEDALDDAESSQDSVRIYTVLGHTDAKRRHDLEGAIHWFETAERLDPAR